MGRWSQAKRRGGGITPFNLSLSVVSANAQSSNDVQWVFNHPISLTAGTVTGFQVNSGSGFADPVSATQVTSTALLLTYAAALSGSDTWRVSGVPTGIANPSKVVTPESGTVG